MYSKPTLSNCVDHTFYKAVYPTTRLRAEILLLETVGISVLGCAGIYIVSDLHEKEGEEHE